MASTQRIKRVWFDTSYIYDAEDLNTPASFTCPNCDGDITELEHSTLGICGDCFYAVSEHVHHQQECLH